MPVHMTARGIIFVLLYVDDIMILVGDDIDGISDLKAFLSRQCEIQDLGTLSYYLALEISSNSYGYYPSQAKYAFDLLTHAGITGKPLSDATLDRRLAISCIHCHWA